MTAPTEARREEVALLPCPFCDAFAEAYIAFPQSDYAWHVGVDHAEDCPLSGLDSHCYQTLEKLEAAWNTRALSPSSPDVLRRCGEVESLIRVLRTRLVRMDTSESGDEVLVISYTDGEPDPLCQDAATTLSQLCERASAGEADPLGDGSDYGVTPIGEGEVEQLRTKLRMVVSHATGGSSSDIDASVNDICCRITQNRNHIYQAGKDLGATTAEARLAEMEGALDDLQKTEAEYRKMHDLHGDDSMWAGHAWDIMRRAGDKARALLATIDKGKG